jgi:hypothetical protein
VKTLAVEVMRQTPLEAIRFLDILGITATIATRREYEGVGDCVRRVAGDESMTPLRKSPEGSLQPQERVQLQQYENCTTNYERGRAKQRLLAKNRVFEFGGKRLRAQSTDSVLKKSDSESEFEDASEKETVALLQRCQQVDNYVSVREKMRLFESLCRRGCRLAQSSDDVCRPAGTAEVKARRKKRARSLQGFGRSNVGVREICRYFEARGQLEQNIS